MACRHLSFIVDSTTHVATEDRCALRTDTTVVYERKPQLISHGIQAEPSGPLVHTVRVCCGVWRACHSVPCRVPSACALQAPQPPCLQNSRSTHDGRTPAERRHRDTAVAAEVPPNVRVL